MAYDDEDGAPAKDDAGIILECKERFKAASTAEAQNRSEAVDDRKFLAGIQWPADVQRDREADGRPCLTINLTQALNRRVKNNLRQLRPRIKVHPVGDGADMQTAKLVNGITRHIEVESNADLAYDTGVADAVDIGWGFWRIITKYESHESFDQCIYIDPVMDAFTVYLDPSAEQPDGSDAHWCILTEMLRRETYAQKYPELAKVGFTLNGVGDNEPDWSTKYEIRVAEYFRVELKQEMLYRLTDGSTRFESQLPDPEAMAAAGLDFEKNREGKRKARPSHRRKVMWYKLNNERILERREWPGFWIPVVRCLGRSIKLEGRTMLEGMTRQEKDPARMLNYWETSKTEVIALQPKAPWLVAKGQIKGNNATWDEANKRSYSYLEYNPVTTKTGELVPPPQRQAMPGPAAGLIDAAQGMERALMSIAGMPHEPAMDAPGQVISGVALQRRQALSDISHYDFYDNQTRAIRHTGRIILDLVPKVYDTERLMRIIGDDGTPAMTKVNEKVRDAEGNVLNVKNNLLVGKYDVVMDTGPAYDTKREEGADAMLALLGTKIGEKIAQVGDDLIVRNMDFAGADVLADRLAAMNPLTQIDQTSDIPPQAQMQIKGLQQQLQQVTQHAQMLEGELKSKIGLEHIRQAGEDRRAKLADDTKRFDTIARVTGSLHNEEIRAGSKILDAHVVAGHAEAREARGLVHDAERAEKASVQ